MLEGAVPTRCLHAASCKLCQKTLQEWKVVKDETTGFGLFAPSVDLAGDGGGAVDDDNDDGRFLSAGVRNQPAFPNIQRWLRCSAHLLHQQDCDVKVLLLLGSQARTCVPWLSERAISK